MKERERYVCMHANNCQFGTLQTLILPYATCQLELVISYQNKNETSF